MASGADARSMLSKEFSVDVVVRAMARTKKRTQYVFDSRVCSTRRC